MSPSRVTQGAAVPGPTQPFSTSRRISRVRRVADLLVERGLAEFRDTPIRRRVRLLACTEAGWAVHRVTHEQHPWAARIGAQVGAEDLRAVLATMRRLVEALEADRADGGEQHRAHPGEVVDVQQVGLGQVRVDEALVDVTSDCVLWIAG